MSKVNSIPSPYSIPLAKCLRSHIIWYIYISSDHQIVCFLFLKSPFTNTYKLYYILKLSLRFIDSDWLPCTLTEKANLPTLWVSVTPQNVQKNRLWSGTHVSQRLLRTTEAICLTAECQHQLDLSHHCAHPVPCEAYSPSVQVVSATLLPTT